MGKSSGGCRIKRSPARFPGSPTEAPAGRMPQSPLKPLPSGPMVTFAQRTKQHNGTRTRVARHRMARRGDVSLDWKRDRGNGTAETGPPTQDAKKTKREILTRPRTHPSDPRDQTATRASSRTAASTATACCDSPTRTGECDRSKRPARRQRSAVVKRALSQPPNEGETTHHHPPNTMQVRGAVHRREL